MIAVALKEFGTLVAPGDADNPKIVGWQAELEAAGLGGVYAGVYRPDAVPWCGLFMAVVAHRANIERRPERNPPRLYLSALEWASFGMSAKILQTRTPPAPSMFWAAINPIAFRSRGYRAIGSWRCAARPTAPGPPTSASSLSPRAGTGWIALVLIVAVAIATAAIFRAGCKAGNTTEAARAREAELKSQKEASDAKDRRFKAGAAAPRDRDALADRLRDGTF